MTNYKAEIMSVLGNMPSQQVWDDRIANNYLSLIRNWSEDLAHAVLLELTIFQNLKFRPTMQELAEIAAQAMSPTPDPGLVYQEVTDKVERYGVNGRPGPNGRIRLPGMPPMSHPVVGATVQRLGGWSKVCNWDHLGEARNFRKALEEAYKGVKEEWVRGAKQQLLSVEPHPMFTTKYRLYRPHGEQRVLEPAAEAARIATRGPRIPAPEPVRRLLKALE